MEPTEAGGKRPTHSGMMKGLHGDAHSLGDGPGKSHFKGHKAAKAPHHKSHGKGHMAKAHHFGRKG